MSVYFDCGDLYQPGFYKELEVNSLSGVNESLLNNVEELEDKKENLVSKDIDKIPFPQNISEKTALAARLREGDVIITRVHSMYNIFVENIDKAIERIKESF